MLGFKAKKCIEIEKKTIIKYTWYCIGIGINKEKIMLYSKNEDSRNKVFEVIRQSIQLNQKIDLVYSKFVKDTVLCLDIRKEDKISHCYIFKPLDIVYINVYEYTEEIECQN